MKNTIQILNDTISRTSPGIHPIKRAMLINRALCYIKVRQLKARIARFQELHRKPPSIANFRISNAAFCALYF